MYKNRKGTVFVVKVCFQHCTTSSPDVMNISTKKYLGFHTYKYPTKGATSQHLEFRNEIFTINKFYFCET